MISAVWKHLQHLLLPFVTTCCYKCQLDFEWVFLSTGTKPLRFHFGSLCIHIDMEIWIYCVLMYKWPDTQIKFRIYPLTPLVVDHCIIIHRSVLSYYRVKNNEKPCCAGICSSGWCRIFTAVKPRHPYLITLYHVCIETNAPKDFVCISSACWFYAAHWLSSQSVKRWRNGD